jgi:prepilin-type processing-associated H-X9-DG protein
MPIAFTCPHCGRQTTVADQYAGQSGPCAGCGQLITIPGTPAGVVQTVLPPAPGRAPTSGWVIALVVVGAILGLCVCGGVPLLLPAVQKTREAGARAGCMNNLRTIGMAMQQYQQQHGTFPPAYIADSNGRPKHSWRALLLPYLDPGLARQYDYNEPWDGPNNRRLSGQMPSVFACPSDDAPSGNRVTTSYVVISGPGAIFDGEKASGFASIQDGSMNTLLVVEAAEAEIPWMEPRDLNLAQINLMLTSEELGISSHHPKGANVVMADGTVHFLPSTTPAQELHGLVTAAGGEPVTPP